MAIAEGLLAGASAGAVFGGPVGALVGAGVGLVARLGERNMLDQQAAEAQLSVEADRRLQTAWGLASSSFTNPYDKTQAGVITEHMAALRAASLSADPDTRREAQRGMLGYFPVINDELERIQGRAASVYDTEVGRINALTDETRKHYDGAVAAAQSAEATGQSIHQLLASDIPTDSPLLAGSVISILQQSQRNMLVDPYGTPEYIRDTLGSIPVVGGMLSGYMAGQVELAENTLTREDFRQVADAFLVGSRNAQAAAIANAQARGQEITAAAAKIGYDPAVQVAAQLNSEVRTEGGIQGKGAYPDVAVRPVVDRPGVMTGSEPGKPDPLGVYGDAARRAAAVVGSDTSRALGDFVTGIYTGSSYGAGLRPPAPQQSAPLQPGEAWGGGQGKVDRRPPRRVLPNRSRRMNQ